MDYSVLEVLLLLMSICVVDSSRSAFEVPCARFVPFKDSGPICLRCIIPFLVVKEMP